VEALNALRHRYTYVFTTGGIGPTHDDITADCVAKAFGVPIDVDPRALAILQERLRATGAEMNEARLRMTRIPKGADLVINKVSGAPGIWIGNVIVMAGVPTIMQAMLDEVAPKLKTGVRMLSQTVRADAREGDIGTLLGEIAKANPEVAIGSYPFFDPQHGPNTNVVLRARDAQKLALAMRAVEGMLQRVRGAQSSGGTPAWRPRDIRWRGTAGKIAKGGGVACEEAVMPFHPTRRRVLGALAATGFAFDDALAAPLAATPACHDGDEPTVRQTEGPYFKPSSPLRADLVEPNSTARPVEL